MEAQLNLPPKKAPPQRMSLEEFLQWMDSDVWAEWINGEVRYLSPVSEEHADLFGFLGSLMRIFVEHNHCGRVLTEPFVVRLSELNLVYSPDIFFVEQSRLYLLRRTYLDAVPDLVAEIVGPESRERDTKEKYANYQKAGVREYWVIDPRVQTCGVLRAGSGRFLRAASARFGGRGAQPGANRIVGKTRVVLAKAFT